MTLLIFANQANLSVNFSIASLQNGLTDYGNVHKHLSVKGRAPVLPRDEINVVLTLVFS